MTTVAMGRWMGGGENTGKTQFLPQIAKKKHKRFWIKATHTYICLAQRVVPDFTPNPTILISRGHPQHK